MLGDFIMAPATEEVKEEQKCVTGEAEVEQPVDGKDAIAAAAPASSWWGGLGSVGGIAAVVRAQLDSVVQTAALTDWRAELSTLREGLQDEGTEAVHAARGAVQQLPSTVERVAARLPATPAVLSEHVIAAQHAASAGLHRLVEGTSHLFDQVSYAIQSELGGGSEGGGADAATEARAPSVTTASTSYSRLEADVAAMQRDSATYCDEPEDAGDFAAWRVGFDLAERQPDIDCLVAENTFMRELQARIVPLIVEHDAFWTRYFYRLHHLELKHRKIAALTREEVISGGAHEDEAAGWSSSEDGGEEPGRAGERVADAAALGNAEAEAAPAVGTHGENSGSSWGHASQEVETAPPQEELESSDKAKPDPAEGEEAGLDDSWADSACDEPAGLGSDPDDDWPSTAS